MECVKSNQCYQICPPDNCDTFQFMAKKMGLNVLHPGGLNATRKLAQRCGIDETTNILDVGCGSGRSTITLYKEYGCKVTGVDIDQQLLRKAEKAVHMERKTDKITFKKADIHNLPFQDEAFDGAIAQAVLVFTEKKKTLSELARVVKPKGFIGAVELAWKQPPSDYILSRVRETLCSATINAELHQDWMKEFHNAGCIIQYSELQDLHFSFGGMLRDEGLLAGIRIAIKTLFESSSRERMNEFSRLFQETQKYLGYGIYIGRVI